MPVRTAFSFLNSYVDPDGTQRERMLRFFFWLLGKLVGSDGVISGYIRGRRYLTESAESPRSLLLYMCVAF